MLWLLLPIQCIAGDFNILLVLSGNAAPYREFATEFRQNLPAGTKVNLQQQAQVSPQIALHSDLIVTVGLKAGSWAAKHTGKPVLAAMLPSYTYPGLLAERHSAGNFSAVFVDQPWSRQADLLHAAFPDRKKIGLLHSPGNPLDFAELEKRLAKYGASLIVQSTAPAVSLFDSLNDVLMHSDVLLAVPDGEIYNGNNIRNILLSSYRERVPLVGLSQSYVNAGALCAVFSTPRQLAVQARAETLKFSRTGLLPKARFPELYSVAVNREVAMMLGIRLNSAEQLKSQIEQAGK